MLAVLEGAFAKAESMQSDESASLETLRQALGEPLASNVMILAAKKHAARGCLLTLAAYKAVVPEQDIRSTKTSHEGGFSARSYDANVTVPFLRKHALQASVETHWLSQTFSFGDDPWSREKKFQTTPKAVGPALINAVNELQERLEKAESKDGRRLAENVVLTIIYQKLLERNKDKVALTRPKNLVLQQIVDILGGHFKRPYDKNAPRLPQLAVYAIYQCLMDSVGRYFELRLEPLGRMKAADRKAGTVGDVVLTKKDRPVEAVEVKLGVAIGIAAVTEAIEKIRTASVERYFILTTGEIIPSELATLNVLCSKFRSSNGCEIIVNGVLPTIVYYLRLIPSANEFIDRYATLVESDVELDYQHRIAWNEICEGYAGP